MDDNEATLRNVAGALDEIRSAHIAYDIANKKRVELQRHRAHLLMDLYVFKPLTQAQLAEELTDTAGVSRVAVIRWMQKDGPRSYVAVRPAGNRYEIVTLSLPTSPDGEPLLEPSKKLIQEYLRDGWRVAPSARGITTANVDPAKLWKSLEP